jgi:hypothetical protein
VAVQRQKWHMWKIREDSNPEKHLRRSRTAQAVAD